MKVFRFYKSTPGILLGIILAMGLVASAAVHAIDGDPPGLFQLDGDADETTSGVGVHTAGHDWDLLYDGGSNSGGNPGVSPIVFTGIVPDPAPQSIYWKGGTKDIHDLVGWWHKDGSVPDKDDITNAYAAAYLSPDEACRDPSDHSQEVTCGVGVEGTDWEYVREVGDLLIYFGFDRYSNDGDAFGGFWFFQNSVCDNEAGYEDRFTDCSGTGTLATHVAKTPTSPGDLLLLVEYPQGSKAVPVIKAYEWDPNDADLDGNLDSRGHSLGNLDQVFSSEDDPVISAICDQTNLKLACAITNDEVDGAGYDIGEVPVDWPYIPKSGTPGSAPYESFFEGGVNVSQLLGDTLCVSTFLAESRASRSEDAILKDYALGDFNVCQSAIRTEIHAEPGHANNVDGSSINVGTLIHDAAYVSVIAPPGVPEPTGQVRFRRFPNLTCSGEIYIDSFVDLSTGLAYGDTGATPDILAGEIRVEANSFAPSGATTLSYQATFLSGDNNYDDVTAACESLTSNKYPSAISTEIHAGSGSDGSHSTTDIQGGSVVATTIIHDLGKVTGSGPAPTGSVSFKFFSDGTCSSEIPANGSISSLTTGPEAGDITGGRKVASANFDTTGYVEAYGGGSSTALLSYRASYNGDINYLPASDSSCEVLTVRKLTPTLSTNIHPGDPNSSHTSSSPSDIQGGEVFIGSSVHDIATVDGAEGYLPTGDVVFALYGDTSCTAGLGVTSTNALGVNVDGDTRTVESNKYTFAGGYIPSGSSSRGFGYKAAYGGDNVYMAATDSSCEPLTVKKYVPTVATHIHPGDPNASHTSTSPADIQGGYVTIGDRVHDFADVTGAGPTPTGSVIFYRFDNGSCTTAASSESSALSGGTAESSAFDTAGYVIAPATTKSLSYRAAYGGDDFYVAAEDSSCEPLEVRKRLPSILTNVIVLDLAKVFGDGSATAPTGTVDFTIYAGGSCSGTVLDMINSVSLSGSPLTATLPDSAKRILASSGTISYKAVYSGDANYVAVTHACEVVNATIPAATSGTL